MLRIGEVINRGLKNKNISQKSLARKIGVNPPAVAKWISGANIPPGEKLIKIIEILDLVPDFFPQYQGKQAIKKEKSCDMANDVEELKEKVRRIEANLQLKV